MVDPWRATCAQSWVTPAAGAADREAAWGVIEGNLDRALGEIDRAVAEHPGTRLVVLPEMAFQHQPARESVSRWIELACDEVPGRISQALSERAVRHGIFIGANQFEVDVAWPDRFFNCSYVIDPSGEIILKYRRINTASWPSPHDVLDAYVDRYGPAALHPVVATELGKLAILPCGEIMVPEAARALIMRGAELIIHPTNESTDPVWDAVKVARAAENLVYIVSCNVAGIDTPQGRDPRGGSQILGFDGRRLAVDRSGEPSVDASALIDIEQLRAARGQPGLGNRLARARFEAYASVYRDTSFYPANQFVDRPMEDRRDLEPVVQRALDNLERHGVVISRS